MCYGVQCALYCSWHHTVDENNAIFSPYKLFYEITALQTAECDREEYSLPLLPLLTLIQHSEASAPYNSHGVKIPLVKSQTLDTFFL